MLKFKPLLACNNKMQQQKLHSKPNWTTDVDNQNGTFSMGNLFEVTEQ